MLRDRNPYGHWRTTWVNGWSLMAMAAFAAKRGTRQRHRSRWPSIPAAGTETIAIDEEHPAVSRSFKLANDLKLALSADHNAYVRMNVASKPKIAPVPTGREQWLVHRPHL